MKKMHNLLGLSGHNCKVQVCTLRKTLVLFAIMLIAVVSPLHAQEVTRTPFLGAAPVQTTSPTIPPAITLGFNINLNYINTPSASEAAAFAAAESTWEGIIAGYQINDIFSTTVTINVNLGNIDGPGGILGSAGPQFAKLNAAQNAVTSTFVYTEKGAMNFDTSDIPGLGAAFTDVVLHEMGHVLGIGTLWSSSLVGFPGRQETYVNNSGQYTGAAGLAAYNSEFGQVGAFVPVELGGGPGTANSHWNEVDGGAGLTGISGINGDMRNELMTGWLNAPSFISSLTIESMKDIGYIVVPEPSALVMGCMGIALVCAQA